MRAQERRNARTEVAKERWIAKHRRDRHRQCFSQPGEGRRLRLHELIERCYRVHVLGRDAPLDAAMQGGGRVVAEVEPGALVDGIQ